MTSILPQTLDFWRSHQRQVPRGKVKAAESERQTRGGSFRYGSAVRIGRLVRPLHCLAFVATLLTAVVVADELGLVTVSTDKEEYQQGEPIKVTIVNESDTTITTIDQQAFCSIINIEIKTNSRWKEIRNCFSGRPSRPVIIQPNSATVVDLPSLPVGVYRASLIFSVGESFDVGEPLVSSSPTFRVV